MAAKGPGAIPGKGTKIPPAAWTAPHKPKKKKVLKSIQFFDFRWYT